MHKTAPGQARLDMSQALEEICGHEGGVDSWCYISGPNGFIKSAEEACGKVKELQWFAARWD